MKKSKWFWWSFIPIVNFAAWIHASIRTGRNSYYWYGAVYAVPFTLAFMAGTLKQELISDKQAVYLADVLWLAGIIHVLLKKKLVDLQIQAYDENALQFGRHGSSSPAVESVAHQSSTDERESATIGGREKTALAKTKTPGGTPPIFCGNVSEQRSVKFIRWLRRAIRDWLREEVAVPRLRQFYANLCASANFKNSKPYIKILRGILGIVLVLGVIGLGSWGLGFVTMRVGSTRSTTTWVDGKTLKMVRYYDNWKSDWLRLEICNTIFDEAKRYPQCTNFDLVARVIGINVYGNSITNEANISGVDLDEVRQFESEGFFERIHGAWIQIQLGRAGINEYK